VLTAGVRGRRQSLAGHRQLSLWGGRYNGCAVPVLLECIVSLLLV